MTAKEYLSQAYRLDARIDRRLEEIIRLRAKLTKATALISDMPRGSAHDWTDTVVKVTELEARLRREIDDLCALKVDIRASIDAVEDKRERDILEMRYLFGMKWEDIARAMHYDERYVFKLHGQALLRIHVPDSGKRQ